MAAIFQQENDKLALQVKEDRRRSGEELRARIEGGDGDPDLIIRLSRLLDPAAELRLLRDSYAASGSLPVLFAYITALEACNHAQEAVDLARAALACFPDEPTLLISQALIVPAVYETQAELDRWRAHFTQGLAELPSRFRLDTPEQIEAAFQAVRCSVNFYLPSQGGDDRELHRQYADLVSRVLAAAFPQTSTPVSLPPLEPGMRIRVGYLSAHFRRHSVSKSHGGWLLNHNRKDFEVFAYQIKKATNWTADDVRQACDHFQILDGDFESTCAAVRADRLHAVVFLDVGMVPQMTLLSATRLAPVQCATWGHPATTGSAAVDYYFSSELMEPPDGDDQYTEKLIRLPGIGVCYQRPLIPRPLVDASRSRFGLREDSVVFLCCQSPWKYLPGNDDVLIRIAQSLPTAQFLFLAGPVLRATLCRRLKAAFADAGLDHARHLVFLPGVDSIDYWGVNLTADVFLDSIGWSGFNTTMEAVACGLPVVTLPGSFMRGRHSYAILTQLGVTETIARDKDEYVDLAVRLGSDKEWRTQVQEKMMAGHAGLYSDLRSGKAVEDLIRKAVHEYAGSIV